MNTDDKINYFDRIREFERRLICEALTRTKGHQRRAAQLLGLPPTTLSSLLQRLGVDARSFKEKHQPISLQTFERLYLWKSDRAF